MTNKKVIPFNKKTNTSSVPILILAGGFGTRLSEETIRIPKPMVEIGDIPILIHIMRHYYRFGFNDFVICAGYKAHIIKSYFINYESYINNIEIDHRKDSLTKYRSIFLKSRHEKWRVRILDTGINAMTGGRIAFALELIRKDTEFSHFGLTYGDGITDANLKKEFEFHLNHKKIGTVLAVKNQAKYGEIKLTSNDSVTSFIEKPTEKQGFISGGYFFFKKEFSNYLYPKEDLILEKEPLYTLAQNNELKAFKHFGFWKSVDTLNDKNQLQKLWESGQIPWFSADNIKKTRAL